MLVAGKIAEAYIGLLQASDVEYLYGFVANHSILVVCSGPGYVAGFFILIQKYYIQNMPKND